MMNGKNGRNNLERGKIIPKKQNGKKEKWRILDCNIEIEIRNKLRVKALQTKDSEDKCAYKNHRLKTKIPHRQCKRVENE